MWIQAPFFVFSVWFLRVSRESAPIRFEISDCSLTQPRFRKTTPPNLRCLLVAFFENSKLFSRYNGPRSALTDWLLESPENLELRRHRREQKPTENLLWLVFGLTRLQKLRSLGALWIKRPRGNSSFEFRLRITKYVQNFISILVFWEFFPHEINGICTIWRHMLPDEPPDVFRIFKNP